MDLGGSFLKNSPVLSMMPIAFQKSVLAMLTTEVYAKGDVLMTQGDIGENMYFIKVGSVGVWVDGQQVATLHSGDCVGESSLLERKVRNATVVAECRCSVFVLSQDNFMY